MNPKFLLALRWAAALGLLLPGAALLALGELSLGASGAWLPLKSLVLLILGLSAFAMELLAGTKRQPLAAVALRVLTAALSVAAPLLLFLPRCGVGQSILTALCCMAAWTAGTLAGRRPYGQILSPAVFYAGLLCFAAVPALRWAKNVFAPTNYPLAFLAAALFLFGALFAFCRNQANIDYLMQRRRHRLEHLPGQIRVYNLLLTAAVLGAILLGYCFRGPIAQGLGALGNMAAAALRLVIAAALFLAELFSGEASGSAPGSGEQAFAELLGDQGEFRDDTWLYYVTAAFLLWILWLKRREIFAWLRRGWRAVAELLKKLFAKRLPRLSLAGESEYYKDRVETLLPGEKSAKARRELTARGWKRRCRELCRREGETADLREGYRLMMEWLALRGAAPAPSDTPEEILTGIRAVSGGDWEQPTESYRRVRYGEMPPAPRDWDTMKESLRQLSEKL
ncbi:MAG: DUF4129 domain-containing protein [Oscillospiraceae bacterium]|nr:DUF4129 domain-containing protein [Oscillospiraceae bacterium]